MDQCGPGNNSFVALDFDPACHIYIESAVESGTIVISFHMRFDPMVIFAK